MADFPAVYFVPPPPEAYVVDTIAATTTPTPCAATTLVINRVWYVPGGFEVRWQTASPDTSGASYPGPGTFGVDTTNFTVDDPSNVS